jgi:uncharacterized membrane protein YkvA (DUF1232 family)
MDLWTVLRTAESIGCGKARFNGNLLHPYEGGVIVGVCGILNTKEACKMKDDKMENNEYADKYNEKSLFNKFKTAAQKAGIIVVYASLVLYYTLQDAEIPLWAKSTIVGALGYFISPIDVIPDFTPLVGFSDDFGVLVLAIAAVYMYINEEAQERARRKLYVWFGDFDPEDLKSMDDRMKK